MANREEEIAQKKRAAEQRFFCKGIALALCSGLAYGLFTAFLNLGMNSGVWTTWHEGVLPAFTVTYVVGALASTVMYLFSACWSLALTALQGKWGDFFRTLATKPGRNLMLLALLSGPVAGTAYVIALQTAGALVIPISGLCPAIGAILARMLYRQPLDGRTLLGIVVCFAASVMIAGESLGPGGGDGMLTGVIMAFAAAFIWGLEGCVAGYNTALVDYQIGITIRQCVGGLTNLGVVLPLFSVLAGTSLDAGWQMLGEAATDGTSLWAMALSGFFAMYAYSLWYKGNSMCGTALGMACNATFAFWGPFCCWLLLGVMAGQAGWEIPLIGWVSALVMIAGIFVMAVDVREVLKRGDGHDAA